MEENEDITTLQRRAAQVRHDGALQVRAMIQKDTVDVESRTAVYAFSSGQPAPMWINGERAIETLSLEQKHVRLGFMNEGANVLDNHNRWGSVGDSIIGVVERAWTDGITGFCKVRFAATGAGTKVWDLVRDGMCKWVSIGYRVFKYLEEIADGETPKYRAIDWEPMELSFVLVPADTTASVRAKDGNQGAPQPFTTDVFIFTTKQRNMDEDQIIQPAPAPETPPAPATPPATPPAPATPVADGTRSQPPNPAPPAVSRELAIIEACRAGGLDLAFAQSLITDPTVTPAIARERAMTEWAARGSQAVPQINGNNSRVTQDDQLLHTRSAIETAIMHRVDPANNPLTEGARNWAGLTMIEVFRQQCQQRGVSLSGMSRREVAETALGLRSMGGLHSTSDFPLILGNTVNRTLRAAYELQERAWTVFSQRQTAQDFREMTAIQLGEASGFDKVLEGGEYKRGTTSEAAEKYKVAKYGKIYGFTWEMLINDDLGAFTRMPRMIAAQAVQKQNDIVWDLLLTGSGQTMADSVALFHASHGNLAATGTALSIATLAAARAAMRKQKGLDGKSFINITPKFLVVGPDLELLAYQYTSTNYVPAQSSNINVSFITSLQVIVDPRITDNRWYLIAAPGAIDTLEYAFLEGEGELFTEQRYGFDVDGMEIKARMVFAAHVLEYRSFYKNPGA